MARVSQVVILAEDERQQRLIRRYLQRLNYGSRDLRFEPVSRGRGSGEAWVRAQYPAAVGAYRERSARAKTALVGMIDADREETAHRSRQLEDVLRAEGLARRDDQETIVHLIPKRNVETWILNLTGEPVDEDTDHRHSPDIDSHIDFAAQTLFESSRPNAVIPDFCVPSLRTAISELRRLE